MGGKVPHDWKVEMWEKGNIDRILAICDTLPIGLAAFEQAINDYPKRNVLLRQGARVLREQKGQGIFA